VRGFAPTTGASKVLAESGIESKTVAGLVQEETAASARRELWIVDEAGLLSTKQANAVLEKAHESGAKVVLVGDARQHHAVEAGSPFSYLQRAGMRTESLDKIRRQEDPALRAVVERVSEGRVREAVQMLDQQNRIVEVKDAKERHHVIAQEVAKAPERTLVVAPSNAERHELNRMIREELIARGLVERESVKAEVALSKQLTAEKKGDARSYDVGDRVKFFRDSNEHGIKKGTEGRVISADHERSRVVVEMSDRSRVEYDPKRYRGVDVSAVEERRFATGDRVQFREPMRDQRVANGELGTIKNLDRQTGSAEIRTDGGKSVELNLKDRPVALDHAYAVTSHSSQGKTVDRVLVTVDTEHSRELVNREQFYVSVSRAKQDAVVYTDNRKELTAAVERESGKSSAVDLVGKVRDEELRSGHGRGDGAADRAGASDDAHRGNERTEGDARRSEPSARDATQGHGRGEERSEAHHGADRGSGDEARTDRGGAREAGRDAGAGGERESGRGDARMGGDGREVSETRGRSGDAGPRAGGTPSGTDREMAHDRPADTGRRDDRAPHAVDGESPGRSLPALDQGRVDGGAERPGDLRAASGSRSASSEGEGSREGAHEVGRMQIRGEEHRALGDSLPADLKTEAVRLNVASREKGGESIITPDRVRELGEKGVREVLTDSHGDPTRAAGLVAQKTAERVVSEGARPERESGRDR